MGQAFNDVTGDAIRTGGTSSAFRSGYDAIDWGNTGKKVEPTTHEDAKPEQDQPE